MHRRRLNPTQACYRSQIRTLLDWLFTNCVSAASSARLLASSALPEYLTWTRSSFTSLFVLSIQSFLQTWKVVSSSQCGLILVKSLAILLCSLTKSVCIIARIWRERKGKNETFGLEFGCHRLLVGSWVARQEAVDVVGWTDATLIGLLQLPNGFVKTK